METGTGRIDTQVDSDFSGTGEFLEAFTAWIDLLDPACQDFVDCLHKEMILERDAFDN